jgi:hypothetical protein
VQGRYDLLHRLIKAGPAGGRLRRPSSRRQGHTVTGEPASLFPVEELAAITSM